MEIEQQNQTRQISQKSAASSLKLDTAVRRFPQNPPSSLKKATSWETKGHKDSVWGGLSRKEDDHIVRLITVLG